MDIDGDVSLWYSVNMQTNLVGKRTVDGLVVVVVACVNDQIYAAMSDESGSITVKPLIEVMMSAHSEPAAKPNGPQLGVGTPERVDELILEILTTADGCSPSELSYLPQIKASGARVPEVRASLDRLVRGGKVVERARRFYRVAANFQYD